MNQVKKSNQKAKPETKAQREQRIFWYTEGYLDALEDYGIDNIDFARRMKREEDLIHFVTKVNQEKNIKITEVK